MYCPTFPLSIALRHALTERTKLAHLSDRGVEVSGCVRPDKGGQTGGQQAREEGEGGRVKGREEGKQRGKGKGGEQDSKDERDNMQSGEMQDRDTGKRQTTF